MVRILLPGDSTDTGTCPSVSVLWINEVSATPARAASTIATGRHSSMEMSSCTLGDTASWGRPG
eukprot:51695-Eustigmatos_ZCMA.PRE.1